MKNKSKNILKIVALSVVSLLSIKDTLACTRVVYLGENKEVITGRGMDWAEDMGSNLWVFPRGIHRTGAGGEKTPEWTSKYGSVIASGYDVGTADEMNEKGLVANMLYLSESDYGSSNGKPVLSISINGK